MLHARTGAAVLAATVLTALGVGAAALRPDRVSVDSAALVGALQASAAAWNRADLEGFLASYADESSYMTGDGPIARSAMKTHYQAKYFGNGARPRPLRFERIAVRALGDDHALMTGRFVLGGDGQPDQSGWFTLVWGRTANGWRILHDHSS